MNFFDSGGVAIERYSTPFDICKAFYKVRLETYAKRKAHLVKLKKGTEPAFTPSTRRASILVPAGQVNVLRNKVRFILAVLSEELVVHNRKKARRGAPVIPSARRDLRSRAGRAVSPTRRGRLRRSDSGERQET